MRLTRHHREGSGGHRSGGGSGCRFQGILHRKMREVRRDRRNVISENENENEHTSSAAISTSCRKDEERKYGRERIEEEGREKDQKKIRDF